MPVGTQTVMRGEKEGGGRRWGGGGEEVSNLSTLACTAYMTYQWLPISLHEVSIWVSIFQCVAALYSVCVCMYVCYVCMYVYSAVCVYGQVRSQHFYSEVSMYLRSGCKEAEKAT